MDEPDSRRGAVHGRGAPGQRSPGRAGLQGAVGALRADGTALRSVTAAERPGEGGDAAPQGRPEPTGDEGRPERPEPDRGSKAGGAGFRAAEARADGRPKQRPHQNLPLPQGSPRTPRAGAPRLRRGGRHCRTRGSWGRKGGRGAGRGRGGGREVPGTLETRPSALYGLGQGYAAA